MWISSATSRDQGTRLTGRLEGEEKVKGFDDCGGVGTAGRRRSVEWRR